MSDNTTEQRPIEASISRPEAGSQPSIRLAEKHPLAIRWMHWVNFPLLFIMIWSGLLIYWADSIPPGTHPGEVYRFGIGSWTLFRLFPDWFWKALEAPYRLTEGLGYHFFFHVALRWKWSHLRALYMAFRGMALSGSGQKLPS